MTTQKYKVFFDAAKRHAIFAELSAKNWDFLYMDGELFIYCPIGADNSFERMLQYFGARASIYTQSSNC